jgi:hypothetical protein
MEIGLVSSTKRKKAEASNPADLYMDSAYFKKARSYAEENHDSWYILSPKHHLLDPDGPEIEPYDNDTLGSMSGEEQEEWAETVFEQLQKRDAIQDGNRLVFHAGREYYTLLAPLLEDTGVESELPTEGLKLGQTLNWYNERV